MNKRDFKRIPLLLLTVIITVIMLFGGCSRTGEEGQAPDAEGTSKEIVVLFTSDIHCGVNENWGMAGLQQIRDA